MTVAQSAAAANARNLYGLSARAVVLPLLALVATMLGKPTGVAPALILAILLGATIMAAVYLAEELAHYLGEPFGTLTLALAVTVIETSLIVSIMLSEGAEAQTLARDTLIAAIMITINGFVGVCLLAGGRAHHEQSYTQQGVSNGLAMLATLAVLTLVLPNFTVSARGPFYTGQQLVFVSIISLIIYGTFMVAQTIRHRDHFLHQPSAATLAREAAAERAAEAAGGPPIDTTPIPRSRALAAAGVLIVALVAVVLLAKNLSPVIEAGVAAIGAPKALVGIVIAAVVLAPEGFAAVRAARANRVQTSLNLAIGSALATIGLTIPAVSVVALMLGLDLELGLSMRGVVLLALTLLVATLTLSRGRTTIVQGVIHLVIFASYLFITVVP